MMPSITGVSVCRCALLCAIITTSCQTADPDPLPVVPSQPTAPILVNLEISPDQVTLPPGGSHQFTVAASWSGGGSSAPSVVFSATSGLISPSGLYVAGTVPGQHLVIVHQATGTIADTARVLVVLPPPVDSSYAPIAARDWSTFPDKTALKGLFGVEGGMNDCSNTTDKTLCDPHLPVEDFYDLVDDGLFGKVVRYNGGPQLNMVLPTRPGRVAVHGVNFPGIDNVWVRQFVRFSSNYTTAGVRGGQGAASHKMMFLRYANSSLRHAWILEGLRGMTEETGAEQHGVVTSGTLPWTNVQTMDQVYGVSGWPFPDAYPMISAHTGPFGAPTGSGNSEWYELVMHHKVVNERGEHTLAWRQYTSGGVVSPTPWKYRAFFGELAPGAAWKKVSRYEMGVNRNRQWDEEMFIYWGPYEVVDGTVFPNPWGLPGG